MIHDQSPTLHDPELLPEDRGSTESAVTPEQDLQGYPDALGRTAVDAALQQADASISDKPTRKHAFATKLGVYRARVGIRSALSQADPELVAGLLEVEEMPEWLREATGSKEDPKQLAVNLANKRGMSQATAVNVLQWRAHRLSKTQEVYERETVPRLRQEFSRLTHNAVAAGWMPAKVADRLVKLDKTPVYHDDGFETDVYQTWANATDKRILMGPQHKTHLGAFAHEATHLLVGEGYGIAKIEKVPTNPLSEIFRTRFGARAMWVGEAVTERIAAGLQSGDIDNPAKTDAYPELQAMLDAVCKDGVKPVDIRLFVDAYYEDKAERDQLGKESAAAKLVAAVEAAFPRMNIMHELTFAKPELIAKLQQEGQKGAPSTVAAGLHKLRRGLRVGAYYKRLRR